MNWIDYLADKLSDVFLLFDEATDKAASGTVGRINLLNDENHVTEEQYNKRVNTCLSCPEMKNEVCRLCGCPIRLKAKLKESKGGECPTKRWEKLNN